MQSVSLSALVVACAAGEARAAGFKSLGQALASHASAAVVAAATGGGATAANAAGLGALNLANAAARYRSLNDALAAGAYTGPAIPNGIGADGLEQAPGVSTSKTNSTLWSGASNTLTQTVSGGITDVTVTQTSQVAALSWQSFNIGAKTKLIFNQSAGGTLANTWIAINSVAASVNPTTILGDISAQGKVFILNANGILFGAGSQVNVGALVASTASIAQSQFTVGTNGLITGFNLYGVSNGGSYAATFQNAAAGIVVQAGAEITTATPTGSNAGGYVMLLGTRVENDGIIATPRGQTVLAAGNNVYVEPGFSSSNVTATVIGSQIAVSNNGSITGTGTTALGAATNTGIIIADQGDITMVGHAVTQAGVLLSTTTVNNRGTVHLLTDTSDTTASVVLAPGSTTEILPEDDGQTALDSQRAADIANSALYNTERNSAPIGPVLNDANKLADEIGESRIEISTGGTVTMAPGALALAQGGQVAVGASSILLQGGSTIDVSGTTAKLPASENSLNVNPIVPYFTRDSAGNRTGGTEFGNVYIDERTLVDVNIATSTGTIMNVYTQGGLLEVSGLLGLIGHGINEFSSVGGQVTLQTTLVSTGATNGGTVLIAPGAVINLTGGTVSYGAGFVQQSYVQAADGEIFNINDAPGNLVYTSVYTGQQDVHTRWHITDTFNNPLLTPSEIYEPAYVIGRDAGTLTVSASTGILDGTIDAGVTVGNSQIAARPSTITDPFLLAQNVTPLAGDLQFGDYVGGTFGIPFNSAIVLGLAYGGTGNGVPPVITAVPDTLTGTVSVDAGALSGDGFARVTFYTTGDINGAAPIAVADGGAVVLSGTTIEVGSSITAHAGQISLSNVYPGESSGTSGSVSFGSITLSSGATLDASGQWTNLALDPGNVTEAGYANAGSVNITGTGGVDLAAGSLIDVSSGGVLSAAGKLTAASGGNVTVSADIQPLFFNTLDQFGVVTYAATILGYGSGGAGTLSLSAPEVVLGANRSNYFDNTLVVNQSLFGSGFAAYALNGYLGLSVDPGEQIDVTRPVYVLTNPTIATGAAAAGAYSVLLPPLYTQSKGNDSITQRSGASLSLESSVNPIVFNGNGGTVTIGAGSHITVDPKQSITVAGYGQVTDFGTLTAHGGTITVGNTRYETEPADTSGQPSNYVGSLSVWIGEGAVIDASGQAVVFTDALGRRFGQAQNGGAIFLGGLGGVSDQTLQSTYAQVIVRPGAVLNASGASATVDVAAGITPAALVGFDGPVTLAGNGGLIAARSYDGIAFDGTLLAAGAGAGAAGGTLSMKLDDQYLARFIDIPQSYIAPSQILISQNFVPVQTETGLAPGDAADPATIGLGRISEAQLKAGGFDSLSLSAQDDISLDGAVNLQLGRSVTLRSGTVGETANNVSASISAPVVQFFGFSAGNPLDTTNTQSVLQGPASATSTLTVNADLIEFTSSTNLGGIKALTQLSGNGGPPVYTFANALGFAQTNFDSAGDIRFLGDPFGAAAVLQSSGNITFRAAQLYPTSSSPLIPVVAQVVAGYNPDAPVSGVNQLAGGTISVLGLGGAAPAVPYSVGGTLALFADTVVQDGVVRAPEGTLQIGETRQSSSTDVQYTDNVTFGARSITSVSLDGLTVPYGGTVDGVNYNYNGTAVRTFAPLIQVASANISVESGATIDVSGGGTLAGAGFISGRGGSTDVNKTPLLNSASGTIVANTTDLVFAIVPGYASQYAPQAPADSAYNAPTQGEQITIAAGEVPGLAAGTYTLLPAYYDLLPGAFRVELTGSTVAPNTALSFGNFTTVAAVTLQTANADVAGSVPTAALITPASGVRQLSQYDEETYSTFETNNAATFDQPRPDLPQDAKTLLLDLNVPLPTTTITGTGTTTTQSIGTLSIASGTLEQTTAGGAYGATVELISTAAIEVLAQGAAVVPLPNSDGTGTLITLGIEAAMLSALDVPRLVLGGTLSVSAALPNLISVDGISPEVVIESGASLLAGDLLLTTRDTGTVQVSAGATLSALGQPNTAAGLAQGFYFTTDVTQGEASPLLEVSNEENVYITNIDTANGAAINVASGATIEGGGSLNFVAPVGTSVSIGEARLAAKYVDLQVADINIGSQADLTAFGGVLPGGLTLTDTTLNALADNTSQLILSAQQAVNIIGSVALDSKTTDLVLNTPALYGYGVSSSGSVVTTTTVGGTSTSTTTTTQSQDKGVASITAPNLTWGGVLTTTTNGVAIVPSSATPGGRLAGAGATASSSTTSTVNGTTTVITSADTPTLTDAQSLNINATQTIDLGVGPNVKVDDHTPLARLALGYGTVTLAAGSDITAGAQSSLTVYADQTQFGQPGTGGDLILSSPLITAASGAVLGLTAGGTLTANPGLAAATGAQAAPAATGTVGTLGGQIDLTAGTVDTSTAFALPSGKLDISAQSAIDLQSGTNIDLSGRATKLIDQTAQSNGGTLILQAFAGDSGSITQDKGATVNVSSPGADAGSVTAIASGGDVAFNGTLDGGATSTNTAGSFTVFAGTLTTSGTGTISAFDALNNALNAGDFTGLRSFELASGDIVVDQTITAHQVSLGADSGSIDVIGTINAAGARPGSISLSAADTLTLETTALLDAHASTTARDFYGQEIDSENRAHVTLTSSAGTVLLENGATIDVSYPEASNLQGQVVINAPRISGTAALTDVAVQATGTVNIKGADSVNLYAFTTYTPNQTSSGVVDGTVVQDNGGGSTAGNAVTASGTIGLVQINADDIAYMAQVNTDATALAAQLAGLVHYGSHFNLLPGVIIASTASGSLTLSGDLNFSAFRYSDPGLFGISTSSTLGSGEPGAIVFRSANDLVINGSVSDGFALPPDTTNGTLIAADSNGWEFLTPTGGGFQTTNQDVLLPQGALAVYTPKGGKEEASASIYLVGSTKGFDVTQFDTTRPIALNYAIVVQSANLKANVTIPFVVTIGATSDPIPAGGWVATAPITRNGVVIYQTGALIPANFIFQPGDILGAGSVLPISVATGRSTGTIDINGQNVALAGQLIPAGTPLTVFADSELFLAQDISLPDNALLPSQSSFVFGSFFGGKTLQDVTEVAYRATVDQFGGKTAVQGYLFPLAELLPAGDLSWSMSFVSGADLAAADSTAVQPISTLYGGVFTPAAITTNAAPGSLLIDDQHDYVASANSSSVVPAFSVIRTGTGDLSLLAGGDIDQSSLYGIYTAGTQDLLGSGQDAQFDSAREPESGNSLLPGNKAISQLIASTYQAYYPNGGGDFLLAAQGDVTSDTFAQGNGSSAGLAPSDLVGNWLWRQGSTQLGQPAAWWINYGTLVVPLGPDGAPATIAALTGFTGFGALGGGNVTVNIGGNAGQLTDRDGGQGIFSGVGGGATYSSGEGLVIAVGGTGRLLPGTSAPITTGGGSLDVTIGGDLNPLNAEAYHTGTTGTGQGGLSGEDPSVNGDVIDIRGDTTVNAGAIGRVDYQYDTGINNFYDPRALNPFNADNGVPNGGLEVIPGDGTVDISTQRDLVLQGAADPGRIAEQSVTSLAAFSKALNGAADTGGYSGFTLWQATTSISLFSAGGNVTPTTLPNLTDNSGLLFNNAPTDFRSVYPPTLLVTAATGDIIYGQDGLAPTSSYYTQYSLETAPAATGDVSFLAGKSIFANGYAIDLSGADPARLSRPADPAFTSDAIVSPSSLNPVVVANIIGGIGTSPTPLALFALEADTPTTNLHANDPQPARFYAADGDIVNFQSGETLFFNGNTTEALPEWYIAAKPVWIIASYDIISSGTRPTTDPNESIFGTQENLFFDNFANPFSDLGNPLYSSGNLFLNSSAQSVSVIQAGRDILSTYAYIGGPGLLEVTAGRNLYQAAYTVGSKPVLEFGSLKSLGDNLIPGTSSSSSAGAGIDVLAGVGTAGPDYTAFANLYFNPADQANLALALTDPANKGKVQQIYTAALVTWLAENYGYKGTQTDALAAFLALPSVDQGIFVRQVFFAELAASGAQESDPASRFYKSYDRGRTAIDTLFPSTGAEPTPGAPVGYTGAITMYSGYIPGAGGIDIQNAAGTANATFDGGIATLFGGGVQVLDPGGLTTFGIPGGPAPGDSSGIVTFGSGSIDVYALGNVALGQSRIFTTGGGNILIWSSSGDINAGIGAKTTVVYNPPLLVYDDEGDITQTPPASTSGAGIATLQPLPDVPSGDVSLVAPGGTIDPGEAGVRVSGNLTLAAAHVVTTNISVKGATAGAPTVASASLGAVEAAGAAAGAESSAAQSQSQRNNDTSDTASIVDVEVISIGGTYDEEQRRRKKGL